MEGAGWERAHGYASNEHLLNKYGNRVPEREAEWDNRHFWRVSNAEHLEMSENVGMVNLSHFAIYDVRGSNAEALMEYVCVAKVGGNTPVGKGIYTHFLDHAGGIRADLTVVRLAEDHYRVMGRRRFRQSRLRVDEADSRRPWIRARARNRHPGSH